MRKIKEKMNKYQSGQIVIFVALTFVVVLGFAGLAIDGGRLYNDRRITQGIADTVAFTGALVIGHNVIEDPSGLTIEIEALAITAAEARAADNGFVDGINGKGVTIGISTAYYDDGIYYLVTVELESEIPPTFIQLVYDGPLASTGRAVAKARPRQNLAFGYSMFGSASSGCDGVDFSGTTDVLVEGGGVFSNSDACDTNCNSLIAGGDIVVTVNGGDIDTAGCVRLNGGASIDPSPNEYVIQRTMLTVDEPVCDENIDIYEYGDFATAMDDHGNTYNNVHGIVDLVPGRYDVISNLGGDIFLSPGLYCIGSGGLSMTTGTIQGAGVTLFFYNGGSISLTGGYVEISAPVLDLLDDNDTNYEGMLIYMVGDGTISLGGNGEMFYTGTLLAPDPPALAQNAKCDLNGNGDFMGFDVQLICYSIGYTGGANSYLRYSPSDNYNYPATIDLVE